MSQEQQVVVENQEQALARITDPVTATSCEYPLRREAILLNPVSGERAFQTMTDLLRSRDGRLATPEKLLVCRDCGRGPYTPPAVAACLDCNHAVGKNCCIKDQALPLCRSCRRKRAWRAAFRWLTMLGGQ
jgi:hypothetical protein